ncbi:alcohol dehydrogenase [Mycena floridula]|nr:alcohol dehydrogenase [Mycena floridula]
MAPIQNAQLIFNEIPTGYPEPGKTTVYDTSKTIDLDIVPEGGVILKILYLSADPYMRGRMRDASIPSYMPAFTLGQPITAAGVARVVASTAPAFPVGSYVSGGLDYAEYQAVEKDTYAMNSLVLLENKEKLPWSNYLGILGVPGMTAVLAWKEFAKTKKGETAFVTTGAGAVGSLVIQLAKRDGMKVIASAGTDEKVAYMKELGADVAFNYKTESTEDILAKEGPIDVFWDNVGGSTLDAALANAAQNARFIECGMIAGYNNKDPQPFKNLMQIVSKCIVMSGFLLRALLPKYPGVFMKEIPPLVASGELKHREDILDGLSNAGQALKDVQTGKNNGKSVIRVAKD